MRVINKDFNLKEPRERKKAIDLMIISKLNKFPFFSNLLLNMTDIDEVKENENALAYTYFDYNTERFKICLNFNWLEDGMQTEKNTYYFHYMDVLILIYHELLHNYFHHFSRHLKYRENYGLIANIVEDYYINEFLIRMLGEDYKKNTKKSISDFFNKEQGIGGIIDSSLREIALNMCKKQLPFDNYKDKPLESVIIDWFIANIQTQKSQGMNGLELDNHDLSNSKTEETLASVNEKRKKEGKEPFSKDDADSIATNAVESAVSVTEKSSTPVGSEEGILRFKVSILKKNPFLNYVKIKNVLKKLLSAKYRRSYAKPNRKKTCQDDCIIYKGKQKETAKHIVVAVDVSGSVSNKEIATIYDMLGTFLNKKQDNKMDIIFWSACIIDEKNFYENISSVKELLKLKVFSNGGTNVEYLYNFLENQYKNKITLLNITDGYWNFIKEPKNIDDHYIVLTEEGKIEDIKKTYPKAIVKCCRITD